MGVIRCSTPHLNPCAHKNIGGKMMCAEPISGSDIVFATLSSTPWLATAQPIVRVGFVVSVCRDTEAAETIEAAEAAEAAETMRTHTT